MRLRIFVASMSPCHSEKNMTLQNTEPGVRPINPVDDAQRAIGGNVLPGF